MGKKQKRVKKTNLTPAKQASSNDYIQSEVSNQATTPSQVLHNPIFEISHCGNLLFFLKDESSKPEHAI